MKFKKITVRCIRGFRTYGNGKVIADVEKNEIYEAKLYEPTEEYFAKDSKGREFLVGEISFDKRNVILEEEFILLGIDLAKGKEKIREFKMEEIAKEMKTCINPEIVKVGLIAMKGCLDAIDLLSSEEVK